MAELIVSGKTGFLVDTVDEAAEAVRKLGNVSRPACRQWATSQFSQERMVEEYLKVYELIIGTTYR